MRKNLILLSKRLLSTVLFACVGCLNPMHATCPPDPTLEAWIAQNRYGLALSYLANKLPAEGDTLRFPCDAYYLIRSGHVHNRMGRNTAAKRMIDEALRRLPASSDSTLIMEATAIQAQILNSLGKMEASVQAIQPVLSFAYRHKNKKLEHACTNLLGGIELQNGRADMALHYFNRSLELAMTSPYPEFQLYDQMQKGYALLFANKIPEGRALVDKSIQNATAKGDTLTLTVATLIQAYLSQSGGDLSGWQSDIQKAIQLASAMGHESLLSGAYSQLLEFYVQKKDYNAAIRAGNQALNLITKQPMPLFEVYLDSLMYTVHKAMGNTVLALSSFESFHKNKATILNDEQLTLLREQKSQFELREKNLIIDNQQLQLANARKEKILLIVLNAVFVLIIGLGLYYRWFTAKAKVRSYRKEKLLELLLEEEKKKSSKQTTQIERIEIPDEADQSRGEHELEPLNEDRKDLYQEMLALIESEKLYLNPHLDQKLVITLLGTNRAYLYQAISQNAQANFKNIINLYRVREVKRLIELAVNEKSSDLPDHLHNEAGFNSLATYHRIFKQFTGLTPKEYMQEYKKDAQENNV